MHSLTPFLASNSDYFPSKISEESVGLEGGCASPVGGARTPFYCATRCTRHGARRVVCAVAFGGWRDADRSRAQRGATPRAPGERDTAHVKRSHSGTRGGAECGKGNGYSGETKGQKARRKERRKRGITD